MNYRSKILKIDIRIWSVFEFSSLELILSKEQTYQVDSRELYEIQYQVLMEGLRKKNKYAP